MQVTDIDVLDPDVYVEGFPHDRFAALRREDPVHWHAEPDGPGFWAITKHADVVSVLRDPKTYSSHRGTIMIKDRDPEALERERLMLLNMDPPHHTQVRGIINRAFTPRRIDELQGRVEELCQQALDNIGDADEFEFVERLASALPLQVIAELTGIPEDRRPDLFAWSNQMVGFDDPEIRATPEEGEAAQVGLYMLANDLAAARRENPGDDIVSAMVSAEVDGEALDDFGFAMFFIQLVVAGNETTRNAIAGGMQAFLEHPDQWERLREDRSLLPTAIEEILRYHSPLIQFRRTADADTKLRDKAIAEGDKVVVYYASANHDEEVFTDPRTFDVGRTPNHHVAFGSGPHFCLGSHLARMEMRVMFTALLDRFRRLEPAGPVRRLRSNMIHGIKQLPVRVVR